MPLYAMLKLSLKLRQNPELTEPMDDNVYLWIPTNAQWAF